MTLRAVFLISVIFMTQSYRYHTGKVKPRFCYHDTSLSAFKFPWERSDAAFEKIFLALKDIGAMQTKMESDLKAMQTKTDSDLKDIRAMQTKMDTDLQTTKSNFMNILAGITIAIAVIGGTKTLFESIEYIPSIPMKITKIVQEGKTKDLEREVDAIRKELRNLQKK
jgi:hypothetical protein